MKRLLVLGAGLCVSWLAWIVIARAADPAADQKEHAKPLERYATYTVTTDSQREKFVPDKLDGLKVGDAVTFQFTGTHTATSDDIKTGDSRMTFNTGTMKPGQSVTIFFNRLPQGAQQHTFKYHCEYHSAMTGEIHVSK